MADNVVVSAGTGTTVAADEVVDGTLGTVKVQYVKLMDGTLDGTGKALVDTKGLSTQHVSGSVASGAFASGSIASGAMAAGSHAAGSGVDGWDLTQGAIADAAVAAGATGSIGAKLRAISRDLVANIVLAAGANAIGKLAANSGVNIGTVTVDATQLSALGQTTSLLSAPIVPPSDYGFPFDTAKMLNGTASLTPKFAKIVASSSGVTTIIALVTSKKIRVLALKTTVNAAVNIKWQSHVTPTDLTGLSYCGAQGDGEVLPFNPLGWFETVAGEALDINLSGAVAVGGHLTYVEV